MAIANYSTKVPADKTVGEIQHLLARYGAERVLIEYAGRQPSSVSFQIGVAGAEQPVGFRLPSNVDGVLEAMKRDRQIPRSACKREQAERVAWRITRDWVRAQLAIIEAGLARLEHVMLPYAITANGRTLAQEFDERGGLPMLEAPR